MCCVVQMEYLPIRRNVAQDCSKGFAVIPWQPRSSEHHLELSIAAPSRAALAVRRLLVHKYPVLSISRYSFIQMSEMKQDRLKQLRRVNNCATT